MTGVYRTVNATVVRRTSDGVFIPFDIGNEDYIAYLAWIDLGNTPDSADPAMERP
jgi:hypothetical protein